MQKIIGKDKGSRSLTATGRQECMFNLKFNAEPIVYFGIYIKLVCINYYLDACCPVHTIFHLFLFITW